MGRSLGHLALCLVAGCSKTELVVPAGAGGGGGTSSSSSAGSSSSSGTSTSSGGIGGAGGASPCGTCKALDDCHPGLCDPDTALCVHPVAPDGTPCDDGDPCTQVDQCEAGVCHGSAPVSGFAPGAVMMSATFAAAAVDYLPTENVGWIPSPIVVGSTGRTYFALSHVWHFNPAGGHCGVELIEVDTQGGYHSLRSRDGVCDAFWGGTGSAWGVRQVRADGAHHWAFDTAIGADWNDKQVHWFTDSDTAAFTTSGDGLTLPPLSTGNAAGDLFAGTLTELQRVDGAGATVWTKSLGGGSVHQMTAGATGALYATSWGVDLGCGSNAPQIAKIGPHGACVWAAPGAVFGPLRVFGDGNVYANGPYGKGTDLGCGPLQSSLGHVLAALSDTGGTCLWAKDIVGTVSGPLRPLEPMPDGDVLFTVDMTTALDLGCGPIGPGTVVARIDGSTGACLWSRSLPEWFKTVAMPAGDVVVYGDLKGTIDLGNGPMTAAGASDLAVGRIDGVTGSTLWSRAFGAPGAHVSGSFQVDPGGGIVGWGKFGGTVDFGGGPMQDDGFVVKLDGDGTFRWQHGVKFVLGFNYTHMTAIDACAGVTVVRMIDDGSSAWPPVSPMHATFQIDRFAP